MAVGLAALSAKTEGDQGNLRQNYAEENICMARYS